MKDKKKCIVFVIILVIVIFYQEVITREIGERKDVILLRKDSWFEEFEVRENKVFITCHLTIQNSSDMDKYIELLADMKEDTKNGLLKSSMLSGYDKKGNNEFFIPSNSTKTYTVDFIGDFAGNEEKKNRNLPSVKIVVKDRKK